MSKMTKSFAFLCLCAGLIYSVSTTNNNNNNNPGWKENTQYVYDVRGRVLTGLHDTSSQYSGILIKAQLNIDVGNNDDELIGRILNVEYGQVNNELPNGWKSDIADSQITYRRIDGLTDKPWKIEMKNGIIKNLYVNKDVTNWESNIIKSIVSQFQLDTRGERLLNSPINVMPDNNENKNNGVFKTMEDSVTGVTETIYDIHPLPEYILQSEPWLVPHPHLNNNDDNNVIEIVKHKNFTESKERPSYHFGFNGIYMEKDEPTNNRFGKFLSRTSISRAIVTGNLNRFTIQNSYTINKISVQPTFNDKQHGLVVSMLNVTLRNLKASSSNNDELVDVIPLGNLVYRFNNPYGKNNNNNNGRQYEHQRQSSLINNIEKDDNYKNSLHSTSDESSRSYDSNEEQNYWQEIRKLNEAPNFPLLPLTIGYQGNSLKLLENIVDNVQKLCQQIGKEIYNTNDIPKENTVGKFLTLTTLVRIMNDEEIKRVATNLYNRNNKDSKWVSWIAFRDAVAEAGTGPALLNIQDWISTKKIEEYEAGDVLLTVGHSVRQPTDEYIKTFYALITKPDIMSMKYVNESGLLTFTELLRKVYVDKVNAHNNYPVHSYGNFNNNGKEFLKHEVIPYLTKQLNNAIERNNDINHIHLYIRALGNIGHPQILETFEPYLEGKKQCSQFQRLLMVTALYELSMIEPKVVQNVCYRIYQNVGENDEIRATAVYQLMRTYPSDDMLQRMAQYTNIDSSEQVNAAVKSSIESLTKLEGNQFYKVRDAAQSALPLLTKKQYNLQDSQNKLRSFVVRESGLLYRQTVQTISSDDSFMPKGLRYTLKENVGGLNNQLIRSDVIVSSIEELFNVLKQQTKDYKHQQQQKRQQQQQQQQEKWSSENIAKLLNVDENVLEQLEGNWYMKIGFLQKMLSFNNRSIEMLPELIRNIEKTLENGKTFKYTKMFVGHEKVISYPTEMGIPFIYTYDEPTIVNVNGNINVKSTPKISSDNLLQLPENIEFHSESEILFTTKVSSQLSIITPFDNQRYSFGYDKNLQFNLPLKTVGKLNIKNNEINFNVELLNEQNNNKETTQLLHFSTWPYTSSNNIFEVNPTHHIINNNNNNNNNDNKCREMEHVFGLKQTGIYLTVEMCTTNNKWMDVGWLYHQYLQRNDFISNILSPWLDENIEHNQINIKIDNSKSLTKKVNFRFNYLNKYDETQSSSNNNNDNDVEKEFNKREENPKQRLDNLLNRANTKINNVHSYGIDGEIEFNGKNVKYITTVAVAKSNVDPKSRILLHFTKVDVNQQQQQQQQLCIHIKNLFPNTNGLDYDNALKFDSTSNTQIKCVWGENYQSATKVDLNVKYEKSQERQQYLEKQQMAIKCRKQMQHGDKQLPECARITMEANVFDRINMKVKYENFNSKSINSTYKIYSMLRHFMYPRFDENIVVNSHHNDNNGGDVNNNNNNNNEVDVNIRFHPDFHGCDVSLVMKNLRTQVNNIRINDMMYREMFKVHPVFHLKSRLMGHMLNYNVYRPKCVMDKTRASLFNNQTYPLTNVVDDWMVMMQYVPRRANNNENQQKVYKQLENEVENYVILVRGKDKKEVRIVYSNPSTQQKLTEILIKQSQTSTTLMVLLNQQQVQYTNELAKAHFNGNLEIYSLPNGEVKVEIMDNFYVICDGERVKLTLTNGKFKNSVRGVCGSFDEWSTDKKSPKNCILNNYQELIASYTILDGGASTNNKVVQQLKMRIEKYGKCLQKDTHHYVNVISTKDTNHRTFSHQHCTVHKTRYFVENGQVCFTIRPMPVCRPECNQRMTISKDISVFCLKKSHMTEMYTKQIDRGASPDFTLKEPTKSIRVDLPTRCVP